MNRTQYDRIDAYLRQRANATYLDLQTACRTACPWKRLTEMERWGWRFMRLQRMEKGRAITLVSMTKRP